MDAGPFTVHVTGTRFHVAWQPDAERLELRLIDGSVRVTGPLVETGRMVSAGETLLVRVPERDLEIHRTGEEMAPPPPAPAPVTSTTVESVDHDPPDRAPTASPATRLAPTAAAPVATAPVAPPSWRELARAGRNREALQRAEGEGFSALCETSSAADLLALGDAARFAGDAARARQAYLALRRRHPGDRDAAVADFILGRLAFDVDGDYADAARWFRAYLAEAPAGSYACDASGRLIEALQRGGDRTGARAEARHYLATYPTGPHADLARGLLEP